MVFAHREKVGQLDLSPRYFNEKVVGNARYAERLGRVKSEDQVPSGEATTSTV